MKNIIGKIAYKHTGLCDARVSSGVKVNAWSLVSVFVTLVRSATKQRSPKIYEDYIRPNLLKLCAQFIKAFIPFFKLYAFLQGIQ